MRLRTRCISSALFLCLASAASTAPAAPAAPAGNEERTDPQRISHLNRGEVLIVGEVHGSQETPAAFLELVDQLLTRTRKVSVGLEMPSHAGAAGCESKSHNRSLGAFWTRKAQDGRSSQAMREMVCQLKKRAAEGKVRLLYLDTEPRSPDEMVRRVRDEMASKAHPMLILIGNFHARAAPNSFAERLRGTGLRLTSLTTSSPDATTWNCNQEGCAARPIKMDFCSEKASGRYLLVKAPAGGRWDGCMVLPRLTSSPPSELERSYK